MKNSEGLERFRYRMEKRWNEEYGDEERMIPSGSEVRVRLFIRWLEDDNRNEG